MKILAIESSGLVAGIAVTENDNLVGEYTINYKITHSQTLLPMLDAVAKMIELDMKTLDAIAVSAGPGSFTGLRIGAATAKGFGLALDLPLLSVPTVDALAMNLWGTDALICPLMDARRQQTYTGLYEFRNGELVVLKPQVCCMISEITEEINAMGRKVIFLGDGVPVFDNYLKEHVKVDFSYAPAHCNKQRAACVAVLGAKLLQEGRQQQAADFKPEYLRLSQAEQEQQGKARDYSI